MYRVEWDPLCFGQFDEILSAGVSRDRLANAVRAANLALGENPAGNGVHLSEGLYRFHFLSLRVYFHVDEGRMLVTVDGLDWVAE